MKGMKTGGRQKGTPNKTNAAVKALLNEIVQTNAQLLAENFSKLEPYQMCNLFVKMLPYLTTKIDLDIKKEDQQNEKRNEIEEKTLLNELWNKLTEEGRTKDYPQLAEKLRSETRLEQMNEQDDYDEHEEEEQQPSEETEPINDDAPSDTEEPSQDNRLFSSTLDKSTNETKPKRLIPSYKIPSPNFQHNKKKNKKKNKRKK